MAKLVADASVIAKLFLDEEGSGIAIKLKDEHIDDKIELIAPTLLKYEIISALKSKRFSKDEIKEALEAIDDYGFSIILPNGVLFNRIAEIAVDINVSAYDASYMALAESMGCLFCTADGKLVTRAKEKLKFVKHLKEFG